jgi:cystathionine beta-lyase
MLLLSSPHNPGSRVWTRAELEKIVAISKANQVEILSDEIHHDLVFPGYTHIPTATVGGFSDHVITLTSASKTFNLAGMKNSFLIMENEDTQKKYDALCKKTGIDEFNTFGYLAAAAAYQGGADWLSAVLAIIQNNYELLQKALAPFPEITLSPLQGTYLAWLDFEKAVPHAELRDLVQKEAHLAVDYGDWFFPKGKADCHIRLNLAAPAATIQKAAAALAAAIEKRKKENH